MDRLYLPISGSENIIKNTHKLLWTKKTESKYRDSVVIFAWLSLKRINVDSL